MRWRRDGVPGRLGKVVLFALVLEGRGRVGWFSSEGSCGEIIVLTGARI